MKKGDMRFKYIYKVRLILTLFCCVFFCGAGYSDTGFVPSGTDLLWSTPSNWTNGIPDITSTVRLNTSGYDNRAIIQDNISAYASTIYGPGYSNTDVYLQITGGSLEVDSTISMAQDTGSEGILEMSGGTILSHGNSGGVGGALRVGLKGHGTLNMTNGFMDLRAKLLVGYADRGGTGEVNLDGGTIEIQASNPLYVEPNSVIDIAAGTLKIQGDFTSDVNDYIDSGNITAYGGTGDVNVVYTGGYTEVTGIEVGSPYAGVPQPADEEIGVNPETALSWSPGYNVDAYYVYFGQSYADVNSAIYGDYEWKANVSDTNWFPAQTLQVGDTYYWRIDSIDGAESYKGEVWSFTIDENKANDPYPPISGLDFGYIKLNGWGIRSQEILNDAQLSWTPGPYATEHDFYLGTDFNEVNEADIYSDVYWVTQGVNDVNFLPSNGLAYDTVYYWRVDELSPYGFAKGDVWSFKTNDNYPIEEFECYEDSYDLRDHWISNSDDTVVKLAANIMEIAPNRPPLPVLYYDFEQGSGSTVYDQSGNGYNGTLNSSVWDSAGYEGNCLDFDGNSYVSVPDSVFTGFGESFTVSFWINGDIQAQPQDPPAMPFGTYTGVGKINIRCPYKSGSVVFTVRDSTSSNQSSWDNSEPDDWEGRWNHYAFIKDANTSEIRIYHNGELVADSSVTISTTGMNSFKIGASYDGDQNYKGKIDEFKVWDQALNQQEILAISGYVQELKERLHNYHDHSDQAMELIYNNSSQSQSKAKYTFSSAVDITRWDSKSLTLYFKGDHNNVPGDIFVGIEDSSGDYTKVYYGYPQALVKPAWSKSWDEWNIEIENLTGIDVTSVNNIEIGVENAAGYPAAQGAVLLDNLRLYPQRCIPEHSSAGDINNDCRVDFFDLESITEDWLKQGAGFVSASGSEPAGLVLSYQFDEGSGTVASDDLSNGYNAMVISNGQPSAWDLNGLSGTCLYFNGNFNDAAVVSVPDGAFSNITGDQITVSLWFKPDVNSTEPMVLFDSNNLNLKEDIQMPWLKEGIYFTSNQDNLFSKDTLDSDYYGQWVHLAVVKNNSVGVQKIYINGELIGQSQSASTAGAVIDFVIGRAFSENGVTEGGNAFRGRIDDFRVYDVALTHSEIVKLADLSQVYQQVLSESDIKSDNIINMADFERLSQQWLLETMWP